MDGIADNALPQKLKYLDALRPLHGRRAYISFMAVSVGYMWNIDKLFDRNTKRHTFMLDFTCSRFSINYSKISSEGGMILTRLGDYNKGKDFRYDFDDISITSTNLDAYYFLNHKRYSHAAAYSYSKYQLKSSGTAIVGISYTDQNFNMDFANLPPRCCNMSPLKTLTTHSITGTSPRSEAMDTTGCSSPAAGL